MSKYYFGIDLGTTNSAISYIEEGKEVPTIIKLSNGKTTLPSCVMLKDGEFIVGDEAYENRYKENAVYSVKRLMGTNEIIKLKEGSNEVRLSPEEVSSLIIKELVKEAEKTFGKDTIKELVITVPAYFNNKQRLATKKAGELSGVRVTKIINEPTSASLLYGLEKSKKNETILVYDLGGGTFDVTALNVIKNVESDDFSLLGIPSDVEGVDILYSDGDTKLGGDDLDLHLWNIFKTKAKKEFGVEINLEDKKKYLLMLEKVKKMGSGAITIGEGENKNYVVLSPTDMEKATKMIFKDTMRIVERCLRNGVTKIDKIVLVGGSTKNEYLRKMLTEEFPSTEILYSYKPDESVALGASIQALADSSGFMTINDIVPLSLGIKVEDNGKFFRSNIISHGASLPCREIKMYSVKDNTGTLELEVYQGDSRFLEECTFLGKLEYEIPKNIEVLEISFLVDLNGILTCSVTTEEGEKQLEFTNLFNLEEKEVKLEDKKYIRWKRVLADNDASDKQNKEFEKEFKAGKGKEYIQQFLKNLKNSEEELKTFKLDKIGTKNE